MTNNPIIIEDFSVLSDTHRSAWISMYCSILLECENYVRWDNASSIS